MQFKGVETQDKTIVLKAQHPPGCLARIEAVALLWLARLLVAGVGFMLGLVVGMVSGQ